MNSIIATIAILCQVNTIENSSGKWTRPADIADYQHQCVVKYIYCVENKTGFNETSLIQCIKERKIDGIR